MNLDVSISGETFTLAGLSGEPSLLVRRLAADGAPVLYIHGATFPSALSVAYRFEGKSWMDDLASRGFDAWAFDFAGYGGSDRPAGFGALAEGQSPIGRAPDACAQIARVIDHVLAATGASRLSLIAHSWGSMPACLYAAQAPDRVAKLALFGPIAQREGASSQPIGGWRTVSIEQQLARFIEDVPPGHPSVLIESDLAQWGPTYLASDPESASREPPRVKIPAGPAADIADAWSGRLAYDPADISAPVLVARGEWDHLCDDRDAAWLCSRFVRMRDAKIAKATHLMHLERSRSDLFDAVARFLREKR
ncbi:alpha/beta hydrolase [Terrarubrum flagellatum]|uniref:alpha/beta hydrolase n=1 Tax=Terrirubrum flagellatum TaxID=2895980 RepID=UPI0031451120